MDALNVRLGSTETTEIGAVEKPKNTLLLQVSSTWAILCPHLLDARRFQDGMRETIYWLT